MSRHTKVILLIVLTLCLSTFLFAQGTTGAIQGTVLDPTGAPIAGATISIKNQTDSTGFAKQVQTNAKGEFLIPEVPAGNYRIQFGSKGFHPSLIDIEVFVDKTALFEVILEVGGLITTVITIEKYDDSTDATPEIRTNNKRVFLETLPRRTTFGSLLKIVPNTRPEPLAAGFQIDGNSGADNTFFIDGQEVTNFKTGLLNSNNNLPFELLQEVQVRSNALSAEYAGATGGAVSLVTEGGNNALRGWFGLSFAPARFQGRPNPALVRFGTGTGQIEYFRPRKDGGTAFFPTGTLSGPIVKNKLWFLASYSPQIFETTRSIDYYTSSNPANRTIRETIDYQATVRTEQAFFRLDAQPLKNFRAFGTFLYNPIIQDGGLPSVIEGFAGAPQTVLGLRGAEFLATRGGRVNSNIVNGQITWDATRNFLVTARGGYGFLNEKLDSYGIPRITRFLCSTSGNPSNVPGSNCTAGFQNIANNNVLEYEVSKRTTFDVEGALYGINFFGRHHFKFGYGYNRLFNAVKSGYTDTGIVSLFYGLPIDVLGPPITPTPGNLGSGFLQRFGTVGESDGVNQSLYAQDSWTLKERLFVHFGIRFENETLPDYDRALSLKTKFGWQEKIAPRFGAAFDVFGNGRTKIFGNYTWYYDRLKFSAFQSTFSEIFYRDFFEILPSRGAAYTNYTFRNILGGNVDNPNGQCPITNSTGWSVCQFSFRVLSNIGLPDFGLPIIDPDLKPSRTSEFSIGAEQRLPGDLLLSGRFIERRLDRAVEDIGTFNDQGSEVFTIGNPGFGPVCEVARGANLPCSKAERRYRAFEIILDKRARNFFFNANYTFSRLFGNYSGLANSDEFGSVTPNASRNWDLPQAGFTADGDPDNGRLATDRPHVFKAFGGYSFDWNTSNRTSATAFTTIQSGTPLTTVYSLYGITNSILFGRGDLGRTETFSETDLKISHRYRFGRDNRFSFEPFVIVLNLFDERNELGRQTSISSTNFTNTALTQGGCSTCASQAAVIQTIFNGPGIRQFVLNFLNSRGTNSAGFRNDYNLPNLFQDPRNVRFGVRFAF